MTRPSPAGAPDAPRRRGVPAWLVVTLMGVGLASLGLAGFYFGIYFAFGGQSLLSGLVMFALVPLPSILVGWWLRSRFGVFWVKWTLVTFGFAVIAAVLAAGIIGLFGNPGLATRVALLGVLQQAIGLPFALFSACMAGRSVRR